jgi:ppGpp synthetase/RelA/SpoT-type nucleotidyltranferase
VISLKSEYSEELIKKSCEEASKLSDQEWVDQHVPRYNDIWHRYDVYQEFLRSVLKEASRKHAPLAIVETRAKGVSSFAGKILKKRRQYMDPAIPLPCDPLIRVTDLCGGRVITQTSDQVILICQFIEEAFDIDSGSKEDVSERLSPTEFGYRSIHYIVTINIGKLKAAGIDIDISDEDLKEIEGLKAEIQVRTLLEHAWADIGHDLTYKSKLKVPKIIKRQFAALAAVLEGVDREFGRLVNSFNDFKSNFGAYHPRKQVEKEIELQKIVLSAVPENIKLAVYIARLCLSIGKHEMAQDILKIYLDTQDQAVQATYGITLTELHRYNRNSKEYREGQLYLELACDHPRRDAEILCALAESWAPDDENIAREKYREAIRVDASEPVTLSRYLEFEVANLGNDTVVQLATPMIRNSMDRCRRQIEARVNLPYAWSSLSVFHLLLKEPFEALDAAARVIHLCEIPESTVDADCLNAHSCSEGQALIRLQKTLKRIRCIREKLPGFAWLERLIMLGLAVKIVKTPRKSYSAELSEKASWNINKNDNGQIKPHLAESDNGSIVIFSGGCADEVQPYVNSFKSIVNRACEKLPRKMNIKILSGGTKSGISNIVGDISEISTGRIQAFGYLPKLLPRGVIEDTNSNRYAQCFSSPGSDFTPLDPMQGWTDIIAAGLDPCMVKLISYGGGEISRSECAIALALGAVVAVVDDRGLPDDRQYYRQIKPHWRDHEKLIRLPFDAMTIRAYLLYDKLAIKEKEHLKAAQHAHEVYRNSATPTESSLLPWEKLPDFFKYSNFHQIAYAETILETEGLGIRPASGATASFFDMNNLDEASIREMAEMEHGRWNVERLMLGWKESEVKDVSRKLSPYIVPWDDLSSEIQYFDLEAIRNFPKTFGKSDLEVFEQDEDDGENGGDDK